MLNHPRRWTQTVSLFVAVFFVYGCGVGGSGPATATECATSPRPAVAANAAPAFRVNAEVGQSRLGDVVAGTSPLSVTVDPTGKFAYVANTGSNTVSAYAIDAATGTFAEVTGSPFAAGTAPISVTVDPAGKSAYVANAGSNPVSVYTIDARTGALRNRPDIAGRSGKLAIAIVKHTALVRYTPKFAYVSKRARASSAPMRLTSRSECSL